MKSVFSFLWSISTLCDKRIFSISTYCVSLDLVKPVMGDGQNGCFKKDRHPSLVLPGQLANPTPRRFVNKVITITERPVFLIALLLKR